MAFAARAYALGRFAETRTQALTRHFEQAKTRNSANLYSRSIVTQRVLEFILDVALMARVVHVDEVDHDQAAGIAQTQLACNFDCGLAIGVERGFFDIRALGGFRRVDVDRGQRLGLVDHHRAAGRQAYIALERVFDLGLDLEAREKWNGIIV